VSKQNAFEKPFVCKNTQDLKECAENGLDKMTNEAAVITTCSLQLGQQQSNRTYNAPASYLFFAFISVKLSAKSFAMGL
jgi:hypothetical protein